MPQITTVRVVRKRSVQPEQFGNAGAEVEFFGTVLEGEDHVTVARQMLADTRALVYENLGMKLPAGIVADYAEVDTPQETATVETTTEEASKPKGRGRPAGSKNTGPKKETKAAEKKRLKAEAETTAAEQAAGAVGSDDIPGDEDPTPNISTGGERVSPEDDVPGDDREEHVEAEGDDELTAETLHKHITSSIEAHTLTTMQAKQMQREMKVARVRDLDTPEKLARAKTMIDSSIALNAVAEANK